MAKWRLSFNTCVASLLGAALFVLIVFGRLPRWFAVHRERRMETKKNLQVKAYAKGLSHTRSVAAIYKRQQVWFMESCLHFHNTHLKALFQRVFWFSVIMLCLRGKFG